MMDIVPRSLVEVVYERVEERRADARHFNSFTESNEPTADGRGIRPPQKGTITETFLPGA